MADYYNNLAFAILLGGRSSRMGRDKAQLKINTNISFIEKLAYEFNGFGEKYLSANKSQDYQIQGFRNVSDIIEDIGPLGGIYSVLNISLKDYVLFLPCDMPLMTKDAILYLLSKWRGEDICIASSEYGRQPLVGIYSKNCINVIKQLFSEGAHKPGMLLSRMNSKVVDMSAFEECFANINTMEDYKKIIG